MLGEAARADEGTQLLVRDLRKGAEWGGAISAVEMDGFVAGRPALPDTAPAAERLPRMSTVIQTPQ